MNTKKEVRIFNLKLIMLLLIGVLILSSLAVFVIAQASPDNQAEKSQLELELSDSGFDWLINYTLTSEETPSLEVYRENDKGGYIIT